MVVQDSERRQRAKKGLLVYFSVLVPLSGLVEAAIWRAGGAIEKHVGLVFALMWAPALASLVARVALREGVRDVSFRLAFRKPSDPATGPRGATLGPLLLAWLFPLAVGLVGYGLAWSTGLETFAARPMAGLALQSTPAWVRFLTSTAVMLTLGTVLSAATAMGEELGWRGYMLTRLVDAGVPRPVLVSSLVWGAWHLPLILSGQYASGPHPWLSAGCFLVCILGGGTIAGRVRLASGSVWPAILFHSAWNSLIQGTFDGFTAGGDASHGTTIWTGESGVLVAVVSLGFALVAVRKPFAAFRSPDDPMGIVRAP